MSRLNLPENLRPLEKYVRDVECLEHPSPVGGGKVEVFHDSGCFSVANITAIEIRENIKQAHDWQHFSVELR